MIPATIPRWSRFATFISVLISVSSFLLLGNYFIFPLRAECGLEYLSERNWSSQSKGVEVNLCNEQEEILASYLATNGSWACNFDNFNQSKPDEYDYADIPF